MTTIKCKHCGLIAYPDDYTPTTRDRLIQGQLCFSCFHWSEQLRLDKEKRGVHGWVVIDGTHYAILPDAPDAYFKGYGGHEFIIEFFDGTRITTHNLWCQGDIPDTWKDKFPDNAVFIKN